jgi:sacsin
MPSVSAGAEVEKLKLVQWEKGSKRLLIHKPAFEEGKADLEFVSSFADELAQGLLAQEANTLSKIIQMAFMFDFNEKEVDFLLMKENLQLLVEDEQFLAAVFISVGEHERVYQKRPHNKTEQAGPPTEMVAFKKLRHE